MDLVKRVLLLVIYLQLWTSSAENARRIRIYLKDDESLLVPKNSKVSILKPVVVNYHDKIRFNPGVHFTKTPTNTNNAKVFDHLYNLNAFNNFQNLNSLHRPVILPSYIQAAVKLPQAVGVGAAGVPGGGEWAAGAGAGGAGVKGPSPDVKPVHEHIEDDIKYDFRTKTHSIRR